MTNSLLSIEKYKVLSLLGTGATSEVFEASRETDGKPVALKRFSSLVINDSEVRNRISREIEILGVLKHPNIVSLYQTFDDGKNFGLELEFIDGNNLSEWRKSYKAQLIEPLVWILSQVAEALAAAHEKEILHRDLKPENILISDSGDVKLTDFGLARSLSQITLTKSGLLIGSLCYMAPEVISFEQANFQSDLYSFGMVAYELLSGEKAFTAETPQAVIRQISEGKFTPLTEKNALVPRKLSALIESCISIKPENRPLSIWHVRAELMSFLVKSELMSACKDLVSVENRDGILLSALKTKSTILQQKIQNSDLAKEERLEALRHLSILFPQNEKLPEFLASFQKPKKQKPYWLLLIAFPLLLGIAGFLYWQQLPSTPVPQPVMSQQIPQQILPEKLEPTAVAPVPQITKSTPNSIRTGYVSFLVSDDVDVFVGGQFVAKELQKRFPLKPGKHLVRMIKEGFLPIESTVIVKAGQTVVVRAGSPQ